MNSITRGTTPTIEFTFRKVSARRISKAYFTFIQLNANLKIEKDLSSAMVSDDSISWRLTQEETLSLKAAYRASVQCRWVLSDGTVGSSDIYPVAIKDVLKEGLIE